VSTVKANNVQVGQSGTATNNFTLYQPSSPDGTVRLAVGNSGATSADVLTANSSGNVGIGTSSPSALGGGGLTLGTTSAGKNLIMYSSSDGNNGLVQFIDFNAANAFQINGNSANIGLYGYGSRPMIFYTNGTERFRIDSTGAWGLSGANYGSAGQALVSQGSGLPPVWGSAGVSTAKAVALALVFG
jgi:hypothetical protein